MSLVFILVSAIALALLVFVVQRWLRLPGDAAQEFRVITADGWALSVWHRAPEVLKFKEPVFFAHGLANNHLFFDFGIQNNVMRHFASLGFNCYAIDFRGAGNSTASGPGPFDFSVDTHINTDAPAALDFVLNHSKAKQVIWVGHSLGGLIGLCCAALTEREKIKALVTIGSPAFLVLDARTVKLLQWAKFLSPWNQIEAHAIALTAPFAGMFKLKGLLRHSVNVENLRAQSRRWAAAHVFAPMWSGVLSQMTDWAEHGVFRNTNKTVNYREAITTISVPMQVIGGSVDLLCPPLVTEQLKECLSYSTLNLFGTMYGHSIDYGHGDLILGDAAPVEVFPVMAEFVSNSATPIPQRHSERVAVEPLTSAISH
jgi:pimeloyl-ACP methyl ester carboxylesterase